MKQTAEDMNPYDYNYTVRKSVAEYADALQDMKDARDWIYASNAYLAIERGDVPNTTHNRNAIWLFVRKQMQRDEFADAYWTEQLQRLENEECERQSQNAEAHSLAVTEADELKTISIDVTIEIEQQEDGRFKTTLRGMDSFERTYNYFALNLDEALQNGAYLLNAESRALMDVSAKLHAERM